MKILSRPSSISYKLFFLLPLLFILTPQVKAQTQLTWELLAQVQYKSYYNLGAGDMFDKPKFSKAIKALEGQEVTIKGYILPLDVDGNHYVLSANPYSACFFCGGAGPESVMELWLVSYDKRYKTDDVVTFKGILMLNSEPMGLSYILKDAEPVED